MLSKTGGDAKKLTSEEVKKMQAALKKLGSGSVARVKSLLENCTTQCEWKKRDEPPKEHTFEFSTGNCTLSEDCYNRPVLVYCILMYVPLYLIFRPS